MATPAGLKKVAAWLPAVVVVPAVLAGAVQVSLSAEKHEELRALAQLDVGTTWVYAVYDHGEPSGTRTRQVTGQAGLGVDLLDAVTVRSHYTDHPTSGDYSDIVYLGLDDDSLDQHAVFSGTEHLAIDPPAPAYELPLEVGRTWSYEGTVGTAELRFESELEAIEDVEVGGRTFTDCARHMTVLRWKFAGQDEFGPGETYEEWTCPGYGPVRSTNVDPANDVDITEELVEFHGPGANWSAEAPGEPGEPDGTTPPGGTVGFDQQRTFSVDGELEERLAWSDGRSTRFDFPPVADDEVMVLAERDGEVSAMETGTGEMRWRLRLTGPIVATPTIAGDRVLVADSAKNLWALSLADGTALWVRELGDIVTDSPAVADGTVVVATEDRRVTAFDLADGSTGWQVQHGTIARTAPAVDGDQVVVADRGGEVTAYAVADGEQRWSRTLEGGVLAGPTVADGRVVVGDDEGIIYSLDAGSGELDWQERTVYYPSEGFAVGNGAVVSIGDGVRVEAYDLDDGDERWSFDVDSDAPAAIVGDQAVTVDDEARVLVRDLATGAEEATWRLPLPTPQATAIVGSAPGLVDGSLVFNADVTAEGHASILYAYPVVEAAARHGVSFYTDARWTPTSANGTSALVDDVLFTPGIDQALYRSAADAEPEKLFTGRGLLPGVVRASDDVVVSQDGAEVLALPVDGGDPLWRYESVEAYPGGVPAVDGDTVFVPRQGVGLAAVSLDDGRERWAVDVELPLGTSPPLPLPDGDVVYGGGTLGRYDGATGRLRWSVLDGVLFNNAAYADGLVFADLYRTLSASGLTAIDARTGETVWSKENPDTQLVVGPVAGEGVVVHVDAKARVTAYAAATGERLWSLQLSTAVAGHPVILDGRVYLAESGRKEDLFQREYRVSAHDLRTGEFLGSYQPPGSAWAITPSVGGSDGALLVPGHGARGPVVMVLRPRP